MTYLVEVPGGDAGPTEFADWAELQALLANDGNVSREDLLRSIKRPGIVSTERAESLTDDTFLELGDRVRACRLDEGSPAATYPFELADGDQLLEVKTNPESLEVGHLYLFLLAITRWSMESGKRKLGGIDPTETFERLCADVLAAYWGGRDSHAGTHVVGTAGGGTKRDFKKEIDLLCEQLGEGSGWKKGAKSPGAGDGGLDVAVWRRFGDRRAGALVGFAQCKTGVHWNQHLGKLHSRAFCGDYMRAPLLIDPLVIYMIPHRLPHEEWDSATRRSGGLFFDRCRIVQYAHAVEEVSLDETRAWLSEALRATKTA